MITTTSKYGYKAFSPRTTKNGKVFFSIRDYEKDKKDEKNYVTVIANNHVTVEDGEEVKLTAITGLSLSRFKDKNNVERLSVTLFADVDPQGIPVIEPYTVATQPIATEDDLPF